MTEDLMRRLLSVAQMQIELEKKIHAGTELESISAFTEWLKNGNFVRARRLFFPIEMEDAEATASSIRTALMGGAKLSEVLSKEQIANGASLLPADYFFRGLNNTDLESAALELNAVGDVSGVVTATDGYSILIRVEDPLTASTSDEQQKAQNDQSLKALAETAFTRFREKKLTALIDSTAAKLTVEWNELGKSTVLLEIE